MRKIVVASLVLVLSVAAFAAVRVGVYGVCPLTGKPLCPRTGEPLAGATTAVECPPTPACPYDDERCAQVAASAASQETPADANECPRTRSRCECTAARECLQETPPAPAAEKPAQQP